MPVPDGQSTMKDFLVGAAALVAIIVAVAGWIKAAASGKQATAAKVTATNADARSEEALGQAKQAAEALRGLHLAERERLDREQALREAPGILAKWIAIALDEGRRKPEFGGMVDEYSYTTPPLQNLVEVYAAQESWTHTDICGHQSEPPEIGKGYVILVKNWRSLVWKV